MKKLLFLMAAILLAIQVNAQFTLNTAPADALCNGGFGAIYISTNSTIPVNIAINGTPYTTLIPNGLVGPTYPAGIYSVTASDGSFTTTNVVVINQPAPLLFNNLTINPSSCTGSCTGSISYVPSGGVGPYNLNGTGSSTSPISNLCAGVYTLTLTDANSCTTYATLSINAGSQYNIVPSTTQNCANGTNSVTLSATSGAASPVSYTMQPGNLVGSSFTNLAPNNYTVYAIDANGCNANTSIQIGQLTLSSTNASISCTGTSVVTLNGANTYSVNGSTISSNTFTANVNTTYSIAGTDASGCSGNISVYVFSQVFTPNVNAAACNGTNSGSVSLVGSASYTLMPMGTTNTTGLFNNLAAGMYTLNSTTAAGCALSTAVNISQANGPQITLNGASCGPIGNLCASPNGNSINLPYTYAWSNGSTTSCNYNLAPGTYSVQVTDALGCQNTFSSTLVANTTMTINTIPLSSATCSNPQATYSIVVTGGTPPYYYSNNTWPPINVVNNVVTVFNTGMYIFTVTDAQGCSSSHSIFNNAVNTLSLSVNPIADDTCGQGTGAFCVNAFGGVAPYAFSLNSGLTATNGCFTGLSAGFYNITVVDVNGCSSTLPVVVNNYSSLLANYTIQNNWCTSGNALLNLMVSGGALPYTYSNPAQVNFTTSVPGYFSNTVTDATGCTVNVGVNVFPMDSLKVKIGYNPYGCSNDTVKITNYLWNAFSNYVITDPNGISYTNASEISTAASGTYTITESTGLHCNSSVTINYSNTPLNLSTVNTDASSLLSNDGIISAVLNPQSASASYSVIKVNTWVANFGSSATFANLSPGTYAVKVVDANGCSFLTTTITNLNLPSGTISGFVNIDVNSDCIYNSGDIASMNRMVTVNPGNHVSFTNNMGQFNFTGLPYGNYSVSTASVNNTWMNNVMPICVNNVPVSISAAQPVSSAQLFDSITPYVNYSISSWGGCIAPALANFFSNAIKRNIYYDVNSNVAQSATINIFAVFDDVQYFGSSVPAPSNISGDTVFWNNLIATSNNWSWASNHIEITFNYPAATPMGPGQNILCYINAPANDAYTFDNISTMDIDICTSYDPNDKQVSPADGFTNINDSLLSYQVRFQNTGNAPAANVIIRDTLDSDLDITSFHVIGFSHPYTIEMENNNVLVFKFMGILLPDSAADEPGSHGFIAYRIKSKTGTTPGTQIQNTANIYFDYNPAIVTNTTSNTYFVDINNISALKTDNKSCSAPCGTGSVVVNANGGIAPLTYSIVPNCANTTVVGNTIQNLKGGTYQVIITDAIGYSESIAVSLTDPTAINLGSSFTNPSGANNGSINLNVTGGNGPYTYTWNNPNCVGSNCNNLAPGTYSVTVSDAYDCTATANFTLAYPTSVNNNNGGVATKVFPNPTKDVLYIESTQAIGTVYLYNNIGQVVRTANFSNTVGQINVQGLSVGVYTLKMYSGVYKIVVQE